MTFIRGKRIAITGAGGSIGSALAEHLHRREIDALLLIDNSEIGIYRQTCAFENESNIYARFGDVRDYSRMLHMFREFKPHVVLHCAAMKHVPICERDESEAYKTNVSGTGRVAGAALESKADVMLMISTDKAADPVCALGRTKAAAERVMSIMRGNPGTSFASVRFHNVLGSSGSVLDRFAGQAACGGPLTVTHPEMERWFSTPGDVCRLLMDCVRHAVGPAGRSLYALDVGNPVKILDLAKSVIGGREIEIVFTGLRPGERLREKLAGEGEELIDVGLDGILAIERTAGRRSAGNSAASAAGLAKEKIPEPEATRI